MREVLTVVVNPGTQDVALIARWRAEAFSVLDANPEQEQRTLAAFVSDQRDQVALVAKLGETTIGTCLLVKSEIDPIHSVTPWLAGLFVAPEYRRLGAGKVLVRAIEEQAKQRGAPRLYLYTGGAVGFYERLGWQVIDRKMWKGLDTRLMARDL
ncbi:MAG: GNAT family N-acetyltransferase [Hyphomicrobiaceae bacterium]